MALPASTQSRSFPTIAGYTIVEQLYLGSRTAVYRALEIAQQRPVVIKVLRREYPSFGELVQFRNQYTIAKHLPVPGVVQPISLESLGSGYALVMEDIGGIPLGQYARQQQPLALTEILAIALQIAETLHDLCHHRVVHKDIKPANILIHPESKQVKLIDFSISSLLPKETQDIQNPNVLEGTLAYLAPEQTGRMNRGIDYRADFYALGITLYQLLTGSLPFQSDDPLELVHCHIAKMPTPIAQVNPNVPQMVSAIVSKLMAKNAEDRYQSARGLKHDLQQCLSQWEELGAIVEFELGERDLSDRFLIPEKLYGREAEVQTLLNAFDRVADGASELMLVAGFSGIGKTAVVNEVHKPITRQQGYFIKGKFDQFNRNIPLSAFVQALRDLMEQLLSESDAQLAQWEAKILTAVGENGQVLIEVIPELEQVIGKQPSVTELSGNAAQNRFNRLFQNFIEVFTTAEHPLVLFLDDLQWADLASLQLVKLLMNDNGYLLMLGAYRDNEVSPAHPFILTVEDLKKAQAIVHTITLQPLTLKDTNALIADTLHCSTELAKPLTELIDRKTQGNPFFTTRFLKALHDDGQITFDCDRRYWECDIAEVNRLAITDDVVEFMALQLQKLPPETQQVLKLAACVGNQFDLATLAIVSERSPTDAATALWKALQEGLILPTSQIYKFFQSSEQTETQTNINPKYRFLHDRVQQAAYSLIPENQQQSTHLAIARLLRQNIPDAELEANIFEIVNHWNRAISLILDPLEKTNLAQLNLIAGSKAKASNGYESALKYCRTGLALLDDLGWQTQPSVTLALHEGVAEAAYLCGDFAQMEQWVSAILAQKLEPIDRVKTYEIQIQAHSIQSQFSEAIAIGQKALKEFNIYLPEQPAPADIAPALQEVAELLNGRTAHDLLDLPVMTDAVSLASIQLLSSISPASYISAPLLFPFVVLAQVKLSIQSGNTALSAYSYSCYAVLLSGVLEDLDGAYEFGQLGLELASKFKVQTVQPRVNFIVGTFIIHCKSHCRNSLPLLTEAFKIGLEVGDFEFTGYSAAYRRQFSYAVGKELTTLLAEIEISIATFLKLNIFASSNHNSTVFQTTIQRLQSTRNEAVLTTQKELHKTLTISNDLTGLHFYWVYRLTASYLLNEMVEAKQDAAEARQTLAAGAGMISIPIFYFYDSLTAFADFSEMTDNTAVLDRVSANQTQLQNRAHHAPMNFQHKYDLVEAELYRVLGNKMEAIDLYDKAIAGAKENGYIQEEALANELAAKFYLDWGKEKIAASYMQDAYYGYAHWGAKAKVQDLEYRYPQLLAPILQQQQLSFSATETAFAIDPLNTIHATTSQTSHSTSTSISDTLDLATILKASQTLSSEIQLDKLLATLLHTVLENAGADKGALLLPQNHQWFVEAVATLDRPAQVQSIPLLNSLEVPHSLINSVKRSLCAMVVADAVAHPTLATDAYIMQQQPKSLLCNPILHQGKLVAILYLENQVTVGAFTRDRVQLLNFLCAQAAISLENARLYQQSQADAQQLEQSLKTLQAAQAKLLQDEQILQQQALALVQLSQSKAISQGHLSDAFQELTAVTSDLLQTERVSIWLMDQNQTKIQCMDLFLQSSQQHLQGFELHINNYPIYFSAMMAQPILAVNDTWLDPRTSEFISGYLDTFNISSMLDANVHLNESLSGVICCEQVGEKRVWTQAEQTFVRSIANLISLTIEANRRHQKTQELNQAMVELAQSQLQMVQNEKMASLGNLVAGVAHEINNPIGFLNGSINNAKDYVKYLLGHLELYQQHYPNPVTSIQHNAEEIDLEFLSKDFPKLLNSMKGATDHIKGISTSLRTFSRADTDRKVTANLHDGIDSTLLILKYRLKANEYRPEISVLKDYGKLSPIECFPGQLNQVFMNILANAIDLFDEMAQTQSFEKLQAHPQHITIRTSVDATQVQIQIRDNGRGMTEAVKAKIFDHLFTTKGVGKGTGLGLAIVRQIIVEKHGGAIEVNSEIGQGAEFILTLPRC